MKACEGRGGNVAVAVMDGVELNCNGRAGLRESSRVGMGVTGKAVGTGPGGLIEFFT